MHCHGLLSQILMFPARTIARRADGCPAPGQASLRPSSGNCAKTLKQHDFLPGSKSTFLKASAQNGAQFRKIKRPGFQLFVDFAVPAGA
jgi:hypothetical protein